MSAQQKIVLVKSCGCDKMAHEQQRAREEEREEKRRAEIERLKALALTLAKRLEALTTKS
jgi:hypothetical protein